ncbi:MAG: hypothetical protein NWQ07_09310 [Flaviramulus sp.]|nr:hypothetical protein [Flaviramulus sp.]
MSKFFIVILITISFNFSFSQNDIKVDFGSVFKNEKREIPLDIVGKDENGYYLLYSEGKFGQGNDMFLRKFDLELTPTDQEINLKKRNL